jgi:hypothetical protein
MNPEENIKFEVDCLELNKYFKQNLLQVTPVSISYEKYNAISKLIDNYGFTDQISLQIFCFIYCHIHTIYSFAWNMKDMYKGTYLRKSQLNKLFSEFPYLEDIKSVTFKGEKTQKTVSLTDEFLIHSLYANLLERNEKIKCEGMPNHRLPTLPNLHLQRLTKQVYDYLLVLDQFKTRKKNDVFSFIGLFFSIIGLLYDEENYLLDDSHYNTYKDYLIQNIKSYL